MASQINGTDELSAMLAKLENEAEPIAAMALYEGAAIVANAFKSAANSIQAAPFKWGTKRRPRLPSLIEKAAVTNIGIATFHKEGGAEVNTVVGVPEGYVSINGKAKAVKLLARAINSGTSFMNKQPVFRKAISSSRGAAQAAMTQKAEELIEQIIK